MAEEKLLKLMDNASQYFHRKGLYVDDTRWNVEEAMFAFDVFDENDKWVCGFFFRYDEDDWNGRTAEKQLRDALAETYSWRS